LHSAKEGAYFIMATDEGVKELSELQMQIWQKANGRRSIDEIYNHISMVQAVDMTDYCNQIVFLVENCLAFIV